MGGTLLLGAPEVTAQLAVTGEPAGAQLAARLWDVAPGGASQTLVARGLLRPGGGARDRWELHPAAYRFAQGHAAKLELSGADAPYGRPSNGAFSIAIRGLELRLPVHGQAGARACTSRRRFVVQLPARLQRARARLAGRTVPMRAGRVVVDLRGKPPGRYLLRIDGRTRAGSRVVVLRRYRTCARKRPATR